MDFEKRLMRAENINTLFLNRNRENQWLNRTKKFLNQPWKYTKHLLFKGGFSSSADKIVKTFWGYNFMIPLWDENAVIVYYSGSLGFAESFVTRFLLKNLKPGMVLYDLGANFGYYSSLGESLGAKVHAFEPNPSTINYVRMNARHSVVNEVAVSDTNGTAEFHDTSRTGKSGTASLFTETFDRETKEKLVSYTVKTITLDSYIQTHPAPDIIKLDVENAECFVLRGAQELLKNYSPSIIMEVDPRPDAIPRTQEALSLMKAAGYESYEILTDGNIRKAEIDLSKVRTFNNFCFKKYPTRL